MRGVGLIFRTKTGRLLDPGTIRNDYFYPLLEKLKLPKIRLHDLRHMHGSFLLLDGVDLATVSARLGHASKAFTMQQYIHALTAGQEKAAEASNQFLTQARTFSALAAGQEPAQTPHN